MSRKRATARRSALRRRLGAMVVLVLLAAAGWAWWQARAWAPPRDAFPVQGVLVDAGDGPVDFTALAAIGASFAILRQARAGRGATRPLPAIWRGRGRAVSGPARFTISILAFRPRFRRPISSLLCRAMLTCFHRWSRLPARRKGAPTS